MPFRSGLHGEETLSVLLVEDSEDDYYLMNRTLTHVHTRPVKLHWVQSFQDAVSAIDKEEFDISLIDFRLGDESGLELLREIVSRGIKLPVILLTGQGDRSVDIEAMKLGADDYLVKGEFSTDTLERSIRYAIERKRVEKELAKYQEHLEKLVEERTSALVDSQEKLRQSERLAALGALGAGIAHEINNPIGAILLTAQNALEMVDDKDLAPVLNRTCSKVIQHAQRCKQIVRGVLQFSRKEATEKWANDLNTVVKSALHLLAQSSKESLRPRTMLAEGLPPALVNPIEIEQVILNLVKNAIEAGSPVDEVVIRTGMENNELVVVIEDKGRGIAEDTRPHIFDPFFTTRQQEGGTGLGLSIVHGIITDHAGSIKVESQLGRGTKMILRLPVALAPKDGDATAEA